MQQSIFIEIGKGALVCEPKLIDGIRGLGEDQGREKIGNGSFIDTDDEIDTDFNLADDDTDVDFTDDGRTVSVDV